MVVGWPKVAGSHCGCISRDWWLCGQLTLNSNEITAKSLCHGTDV